MGNLIKERNALKNIGIFGFDRRVTKMMAEIAKIRVKLWIKIWVRFAPISLFEYTHGWFDCKNPLTREL